MKVSIVILCLIVQTVFCLDETQLASGCKPGDVECNKKLRQKKHGHIIIDWRDDIRRGEAQRTDAVTKADRTNNQKQQNGTKDRPNNGSSQKRPVIWISPRVEDTTTTTSETRDVAAKKHAKSQASKKDPTTKGCETVTPSTTGSPTPERPQAPRIHVWDTPPGCFRAYLANGHIYPGGVQQDEIGEEIHMECESGYRLEGETKLRCLDEHRWSGVFPYCKEEPKTTRPVYDEQEDHKGKVSNTAKKHSEPSPSSDVALGFSITFFLFSTLMLAAAWWLKARAQALASDAEDDEVVSGDEETDGKGVGVRGKPDPEKPKPDNVPSSKPKPGTGQSAQDSKAATKTNIGGSFIMSHLSEDDFSRHQAGSHGLRMPSRKPRELPGATQVRGEDWVQAQKAAIMQQWQGIQEVPPQIAKPTSGSWERADSIHAADSSVQP